MRILYDVNGRVFEDENEAKRYEEIINKDELEKMELIDKLKKAYKAYWKAYIEYRDLSRTFVKRYGSYEFLNIPYEEKE